MDNKMATTPEKKAALYVRVSTDAQAEEGYSIDVQTEKLIAYSIARGYTTYELYIDSGWSGSNIDRPEMQRMISDIALNRISIVMVYKLDRLSRSQKDTMHLIEDVFNPKGVAFSSILEVFDTSTNFGITIVGILSIFAQFERSSIRERTRMGMKERVKSGLWMGGGRIPFGYDYDQNTGTLVPNKDAETVKHIYSLYLNGYSVGKIAQMVGLKYDRLVCQILTRKSNAGFIVYNGEEYQGQHEAIISLDTYSKAMDMMKERSVTHAASSPYLLSGLVYCAKCGAKMRYQKWGKLGYKLVCYSQQTSKQYLIKDLNCDNEKVWAIDVEDAVVNDLFKLSLNEGKIDVAQPKRMSAIDMLQKQYELCSNTIKRLYKLYTVDEDALLLETIEDSKRELQGLMDKINVERQRGAMSQKIDDIKAVLRNLPDAWEYYSDGDKQETVRNMISKVIVSPQKIQIVYKFEGLL
jgi:site-specific DNA recombinase